MVRKPKLYETVINLLVIRTRVKEPETKIEARSLIIRLGIMLLAMRPTITSSGRLSGDAVKGQVQQTKHALGAQRQGQTLTTVWDIVLNIPRSQ